MAMRDAIIDRVRANQHGAAESVSTPVRFIAEFDSSRDPDTIAAEIRNSLSLQASVTRLSQSHGEEIETADDALARFFVIEVAGAGAGELRPSPFEFGYALADATSAMTVEPELGTDFFTDDGGAESVDNFPPGCWVDEKLDPTAKQPFWAVEKIGAIAAWDLAPPPGGKQKGAGVSVFQPDTGVADHDELKGGMIDDTRAYDFVDSKAKAVDPLDYIGNPGHGTGTASVVAGRGVSKKMSGAAPGATLVPLRAIKSVVVFDHGRVAAAVEYARRNGAQVITMSLGGAWSSALRAAIDAAIKDGIIVMAAAGNCVSVVVYPARYEEVIAVAGCNSEYKPWKGTCSGAAVDVTAPGEFVPRANRSPENGGSQTDVRGGQGTSFAVALTAGVAALWLAFHDPAKLRSSLTSGETVQQKFAALLKASVRIPADWDTSEYGAGIVDAEKLLLAPLTSAGQGEIVAEMPEADPLHSVRTLLSETTLASAELPEATTKSMPIPPRFAAELTHLALARVKPGTVGEAEAAGDVLVPSETLMREMKPSQI